MPEDTEYFEIVVRGIEELNRRHGAGHFFLFHRARSWSESEQRWIGWERKRGKLEQLNRFLMGESAPELEGFLCAGDRARLENIRFVITLDADTQLLRNTARRMIETLAHPLNQARLSPDGRRVVRGYTIIQPRSQRHPAERHRDMVFAHFCRSRAGSIPTRTRSRMFTRI